MGRGVDDMGIPSRGPRHSRAAIGPLGTGTCIALGMLVGSVFGLGGRPILSAAVGAAVGLAIGIAVAYAPILVPIGRTRDHATRTRIRD
jgi:hypothetical protein